jgi:tripartite-type tricarboxylate transporter receptor subunit TctC
MMISLRSVAAFATILYGATGFTALPAAAQQYPTQTIKIVVAAAAGGFADGVARLFGEQLTQRLGQNVIVENRGGAAGNLGAKAVADAQADGYTLLVTTTGLAINDTLYKNKGYAIQDLRVIAIVGSAPETVAAHPSHPAKDLAELIRMGKTTPITYGTAGTGSGSYIAAEYLFKELAKVQTVHVPFQGGAPAITALVGNHVPLVTLTLPPMITHINQGTIKGLGIASAKRHPAVPQVPTLAESGFPDFHAASWVGFFMPAKVGDAVATRLNGAISEALRDAQVQQRLTAFGLEPMQGSTEEATRFFRSEIESWGKMVRTLNLSVN